MYNLTVDEAHTFFVGDGAWLVHNQNNIPITDPARLLPAPILNEAGLPVSGLIRVRRYTQRIALNMKTMSFAQHNFIFYAEYPIITPLNAQAFREVYKLFGKDPLKLTGAVDFNLDLDRWNIQPDDNLIAVNNAIQVQFVPSKRNEVLTLLASGFRLDELNVNPVFYDASGNVICP
jgi:hypothetical protein